MFLALPDPDPVVWDIWDPGGQERERKIWIRIRIFLSPWKNNQKNVDSYCFVSFFFIFIFENEVNAPSKNNKKKSNMQKIYVLVGILKVNEEHSRIRIGVRIHCLEAWIRGSRSWSGSTPKCHGSATLQVCSHDSILDLDPFLNTKNLFWLLIFLTLQIWICIRNYVIMFLVVVQIRIHTKMPWICNTASMFSCIGSETRSLSSTQKNADLKGKLNLRDFLSCLLYWSSVRNSCTASPASPLKNNSEDEDT